ncbi:MAG: hypothetical protein QW416_02600 [Candidatus Nitrosocaldaceae archaeon]
MECYKSTFTAEVVSDEVEYTASIEGEFLRDTKAGKNLSSDLEYSR